MMGSVISGRLATLNELQTIYGTEDLYLLMDISLVDSHNKAEAVREAR